MKNFEQIRAQNALAWKDKIGKGKNDGENIAKKVPVMILDNGIIAAAAFALEKGGGYADVFRAIIEHLQDGRIGLLKHSTQFDEKFTKYLCEECSSSELRCISSETMAYLSYLRRFVRKED